MREITHAILHAIVIVIGFIPALLLCALEKRERGSK
jgi:hypothetical protein